MFDLFGDAGDIDFDFDDDIPPPALVKQPEKEKEEKKKKVCNRSMRCWTAGAVLADPYGWLVPGSACTCTGAHDLAPRVCCTPPNKPPPFPKKKKDKSRGDASDLSDYDIFADVDVASKEDKKKRDKDDSGMASDSGYDTATSKRSKAERKAEKKAAKEAARTAAESVSAPAVPAPKAATRAPVGPDGRPMAAPAADAASKAAPTPSGSGQGGSGQGGKRAVAAKPATSAEHAAPTKPAAGASKPKHGKSVTITEPGSAGKAVQGAEDEDVQYVESKLPLAVMRAFKAVDGDGSGTVDVSELRACLDKITSDLGIQVTKASAEQLLAKFDRDGGGSLDLDEFGAFISALRESVDTKSRNPDNGGKPKPSWYKHPHIPPAVRHAFETCDMDKTGSIAATELRRMFTMIDRQLGFTVTRRATDEVLAKYAGVEGDRKVSADEFASLVDELQALSPKALAASLDSPDVRIRWRAASELKKDPAALEAQAKAISLKLAHQDPGVRLVALDVLTACPSPVLAPVAPQVSALLADPVWYVREATVLCLASLDQHVLRDHAIELIDTLEDERDAVGSSVRQAAVQALGKLKPESISSYLLSRTREITKKGASTRAPLPPPPPVNAQPSTLSKVVSKVRPGSAAPPGRATPASPARFTAAVAGERPSSEMRAAAGVGSLQGGNVLMQGSPGATYTAHRTFAPVSWPGAKLPPGMSNNDLNSEPGVISPYARPSRLESARQWANQDRPRTSSAFEGPPSLAPSGDLLTSASWMTHPQPGMMAHVQTHTPHVHEPADLSNVYRLQQQQIEMQHAQQQQLQLQQEQLQQLQQLVKAPLFSQSMPSPTPQQQGLSMPRSSAWQYDQLQPEPSDHLQHAHLAPSTPQAPQHQHREQSLGWQQLRHDEPPQNNPHLQQPHKQEPVKTPRPQQQSRLMPSPALQQPKQPPQRAAHPQLHTPERPTAHVYHASTPISPQRPASGASPTVQPQLLSGSAARETASFSSNSGGSAHLGGSGMTQGARLSSTMPPQPPAAACTAMELYDSREARPRNQRLGHTWSGGVESRDAWESDLATRKDLLDLKRELANLREELDLRRQMQSLILETRDLRSEMASEARWIRSESVLGGPAAMLEAQAPQGGPWAMHGSSHSTFTPMQPHSATQFSFAPGASQIAPSHATPTFPAWTQRPMPEPHWSPSQSYSPVRDHASHSVTVIPNTRPTEQMATPLDTLVRHLSGQAAAPAMRSPVSSASKAGQPRPHEQRAIPMALSTPGLM